MPSSWRVEPIVTCHAVEAVALAEDYVFGVLRIGTARGVDFDVAFAGGPTCCRPVTTVSQQASWGLSFIIQTTWRGRCVRFPCGIYGAALLGPDFFAVPADTLALASGGSAA